jgi:hypothetical protein
VPRLWQPAGSTCSIAASARRLDQVDHHRRGEHVHLAAADARRGVLLADDKLCGCAAARLDHRGIIRNMPRACFGRQPLDSQRWQQRASGSPSRRMNGTSSWHASQTP